MCTGCLLLGILRIQMRSNMDLGKEKLTVLVTYWWNGDLVSDCWRTHSCLATFPHSPSIPLLPGNSHDHALEKLNLYHIHCSRMKYWQACAFHHQIGQVTHCCTTHSCLATFPHCPRFPYCQAGHKIGVLYYIVYISFQFDVLNKIYAKSCLVLRGRYFSQWLFSLCFLKRQQKI